LSPDPLVQARAQAELASIRAESLDAVLSDKERKETEEFFVELAQQPERSSLAKAVGVLADAQRKGAVEAFVRWYWNVGGLRKPYGLLSGNLRGRKNWRYAMSDDLLASLVQLAFVDQTSDIQHVALRSRVSLGEFLHFLEDRFSIIVDRPPAFMDSVTARAAAKLNLEALKRRLRQMGFYEALSDDFTAQHLRNPLVSEAKL